jgi:hypothetical protein
MLQNPTRQSSAPLRAVQKALIVTALIAIAYVAVQIAGSSLGSLDEFSGMTLGSATTANPATTTPTPLAPSSSRGEKHDSRTPQRDFDYFPDHYQNQAKEVAEPIATF